ncbi:MAG: T9SS type A sorting domain-containing protein [Chitinophagaceae bacterium]
MMKNLLLLLLSAVLCFKASAQFNYSFKDTVATYVPLTGSTSLNGSLIWDDENLVAPMPFTWKMDNTISLNKFYLPLSIVAVLDDTSNYADINGFVFGDMNIADRGLLNNVSSLSPISYATVGTAPNRIFKVELANAGFYDEYDMYNTMADSFNIQIWIYETSNIVELHYGPSSITYASDYFSFGSGPLVMYAKHVDGITGNTGSFYYLKGSPASPTIDTADMINPPSGALNSWPANGQVYRFTPKNNCLPPTAAFSAAIPSGNSVQYTYTGTTAFVDSLVWNFGDGQSQKVISSFSTPLLHTFAANGHYTVTVTAYTSCGNNTSSKALALAVQGFSSLGNIKVYPNPANDNLIIEGMEAGSKANILSIVGQEMMNISIMSNRQIVDLSALPTGTYLLMLTGTDGSNSTLRILKQ